MFDNEPTLRTAVIFLAGVAAILVFLANIGSLEGRLIPPHRSVEFNAQFSSAIDAIDRYQNAGGLAANISELEANRELDALRRKADTVFEHNAYAVIGEYWFAVRIYRIDPTKINLVKLRSTFKDVLTVEYF